MGAPATRQSIGKTSLTVPALGFGSASVGNLYRAMSDAAASATLQCALDKGIALFDTAPHYGQGLSERRVGSAISGRAKNDEKPVLSTKVGRVLRPAGPQDPGSERHGFVDGDPFEPEFDYSYDGVMRSFSDSLTRLGDVRIDILLAHDLGQVTHGDSHAGHLKAFLDGGYRAMRELKDSGQIKAIGLGVNEWQVCEEVLGHVDLDVVLLAGRYTLLEQTALASFLPLCERRSVSVLAAGVFNSGILSGGNAYNYAPAPETVRSRVQALKAVCDSHKVPLAAAALQFSLAHPAIASAIVGMAAPAEVTQNIDWFNHPIPGGLWSDLKAENLLAENAPTPAPESSYMSTHASFILLHGDDNVLVCRARAEAGEAVAVDDHVLTLAATIEVGHKIARRDLKTGDKIFKYGAPIGSMTTDANAGDHVHMHNMQSDYIKTHTREATHG